MPDYEMTVGGPVGRVVASCLPGFSTTTVPATTVLRGSVTDDAALLRILDLLNAHGFPPLDIHIDRGESLTGSP